jgi:hypothetical protein
MTPELQFFQELFLQHNLLCEHAIPLPENKEYGACKFVLNNLNVQFRVAKITPTKIGQFVTFWKRIGRGPIMPYDVADPFDLLVVVVRKNEQLGYFIFPKDLLVKKDIISKNGRGGERAMRVYPPWDVTDNKQSKETQKWQLTYFFIYPEDIKKRVKLLT